MKKWLILGGMTALLTFIAAGYLLAPTEVSYEREVSEQEVVKEVVTEVVTEDQVRIEEAQEAERGRIEGEANTMRDNFIKNEMAKIESQVLREMADELDARAEEKEKETGDF